MQIRPLEPRDRTAVAAILEHGGVFSPDEVLCALELIDAAALRPAGDYRALVAVDGLDHPVGYICFGPTPMTSGTWDLYWVATASAMRGKGVGHRLVEQMEALLRNEGARLVRVETSQQEAYGAARHLYDRTGYRETARIVDFYRTGDDLLIFTKRLTD
jgi:ribosomal protein S18 acetylase RimI-like enzyme